MKFRVSDWIPFVLGAQLWGSSWSLAMGPRPAESAPETVAIHEEAVTRSFSDFVSAKEDCPSCIESVFKNAAPENRKVLEEIGSLAVKTECRPLEVSEERTLNIDWQESPTGVQHRYVLARTGPSQYRATLNLEFYDESRNPRINTEFQRKVNACLQIVNQRLLGPNGEQLQIELYSPQSRGTVPPLVKISVSKTTRDSSMEYSQNPSCSTITHELFHLMGLVDEYPEVVENYDCRSLGPDSSLMSNMDAAFYEAFPRIDPCICTTASCRTTLARGYSKKECPAGSERQMHMTAAGMIAVGRFEDFKLTPDRVQLILELLNQGSASRGNMYYYINEPTRNSLLLPGHFSAVIHPGCGKNLNYYQCSADAYRGSKEGGLGGEGCLLNPKPSVCKAKDWLKPLR